MLESPCPRWDDYDVQTASTLYWKGLNFLVRQHDREEVLCELTVRITLGVHRNNHNSRVNIWVVLNKCISLISSTEYFV